MGGNSALKGYPDTKRVNQGGNVMKNLAFVNVLRMKANMVKSLVVVLVAMLAITNGHGATITSVSPGGAWNVASTWSTNSVPTGNDDVVIASGAPVTIPSGAGATARTLTLNAGVTILGTGNTLTVTNNSNGSGTALTLNSGGNLFIGSANTLNFSSGQGAGIVNNGGSIASTGTNGSDGGTIKVNANSGGGFNVSGTAVTTVYNLLFGPAGSGNANFQINSGGLLVNGTLSVYDNNFSSSSSTLSPMYGPASTLYINWNNQGISSSAPSPLNGNLSKLWSATSGTIGVTQGYPNNVELTNMGQSNGSSNGVNVGFRPSGVVGLNGSLIVGDGTTTGFIGLDQVTSFTSGGININNGSTLVGPNSGVSFVNKGNFILQGATTGIFQNSGATINFAGSGTLASPQTISTTGSSVQFTSVVVSSGTYVKLQSPVNVTSTLTLTSGFIGTSVANSLTISNTATTAVTGGSATAYIDGPLSWSIPATTSAAYTYPIGDYSNGNKYLPLVLHPNATSGSVVTATAFNQNSGGSPGSSVTSLSTTEYWSVVTSSTFSSGPLVDVTRNFAVFPNNALATSGTSNGVYNAVGGTPSGNTISGGGIGTNSPVFIVMVLAPLSVVKLGGTNVTCNGTTGSLTIGGSGGTAPYQYSMDGGTFTTSGFFSPLTPGDHIVTIKDATTTTATSIVKVLGSVVINGNNQDVYICPPASTTLAATNLQNIAPVFNWSLNASGTPVVYTGANYTVAPTTTTTYYVTSTLYTVNKVTNGGFESGNTGFTSNLTHYTGGAYGSTPDVGTGDYSITNLGSNQCIYFTTSGAAGGTSLSPHSGGSYFVGDGGTTMPSVVWSQTISSLTPGLVYQFQYYYAAADPTAPFASLQTTISNGTLAGPASVTASNTTGWTQAFYTFTASGTSATISISNTASNNVGNDFYLDDISLLEPCTVISSIKVMTLCPLPIELMDFNVVRKGTGALLSWATSNELNNAYFIVEKSLDGTSFAPIGKVNAAENRYSLGKYTYTDPSVAKGTTYYRLAQYDIDGSYQYSRIIALNKDGMGDVEITPNPNNGVFVITLGGGASDAKSSVIVFNVLSQIVYESEESSSNYRNMDISNLPAGTYYVQVSTSGETVVKKVVKD